MLICECKFKFTFAELICDGHKLLIIIGMRVPNQQKGTHHRLSNTSFFTSHIKYLKKGFDLLSDAPSTCTKSTFGQWVSIVFSASFTTLNKDTSVVCKQWMLLFEFAESLGSNVYK